MEHSLLNPIKSKEEMITAFTGYDHRITATEGSYYDMKNMTSDYYPALAPRKKRGINNTGYISAVAIADYFSPNNSYYVRSGQIYENGIRKTENVLSTARQDVIFLKSNPVFTADKAIYRGEAIAHFFDNEVTKTEEIVFRPITKDMTTYPVYHDASYYEDHDPQNGDYKIETVDGKTTLSVYSSYSKLWNPVVQSYMEIYGTGIGEGFEEGDAVKITVNLTGITWDDATNIFVNDEGSNKRSNTFVVEHCGSNVIVVAALISAEKTIPSLPITISRKSPDMDFIIECQNRLWGCSSTKNEIYCSKLGDPNNWNFFQGISTDSWAATLGSSGAFTGAITYQGVPVFFKANSIITISISPTGAHSYKEKFCKGVKQGCEKSLVEINNMLYYKSNDAFCIYDGSFPVDLPNVFGDDAKSKYPAFMTYKRLQNCNKGDAVAGTIDGKYYVLMREVGTAVNNKVWFTMFVYDTKRGIWNKEDRMELSFEPNGIHFVNSDSDLYIVDYYSIRSIYGSGFPNGYYADPMSVTLEDFVEWNVESNNIGYLYTGKSHASRINTKLYLQKIVMQLSMEVGSHISVYINYDSSDTWEFLFNFSGTTTSLCNIPIRPHRCNHFRYKIVGHGDAKIFSITKYYTEGSNV